MAINVPRDMGNVVALDGIEANSVNSITNVSLSDGYTIESNGHNWISVADNVQNASTNMVDHQLGEIANDKVERLMEHYLSSIEQHIQQIQDQIAIPKSNLSNIDPNKYDSYYEGYQIKHNDVTETIANTQSLANQHAPSRAFNVKHTYAQDTISYDDPFEG